MTNPMVALFKGFKDTGRSNKVTSEKYPSIMHDLGKTRDHTIWLQPAL